MKKYLVLTLAVIMLTFVFLGCTPTKEITNETQKEVTNETPPKNTNSEYKTAILDYSDSIGISGLCVEYKIRDYEGFKDKKGPSKAVYITPEGAEEIFDLSEDDGEFRRSNYYPVYGSYELWFNPDGKMERCSLISSVARPKEVTCSETEAIEVAQSFVDNNFIHSDSPNLLQTYYPSATSSIIISAKPRATPIVPQSLCWPSCESGISSSTTT